MQVEVPVCKHHNKGDAVGFKLKGRRGHVVTRLTGIDPVAGRHKGVIRAGDGNAADKLSADLAVAAGVVFNVEGHRMVAEFHVISPAAARLYGTYTHTWTAARSRLSVGWQTHLLGAGVCGATVTDTTVPVVWSVLWY